MEKLSSELVPGSSAMRTPEDVVATAVKLPAEAAMATLRMLIAPMSASVAPVQ